MQRETLTTPAIDVPIEVGLARVVLRPDPDLPWYPEESVRYFLAYDRSTERRIGHFEIVYNYPDTTARLHSDLKHSFQRQGIGTSVYRAVSHMPLPCGNSFSAYGFQLFTDHQSIAARSLWEKFVRAGEADRLGRTENSSHGYVMHRDIAPPDDISISFM